MLNFHDFVYRMK